jgi:hypothetical protein
MNVDANTMQVRADLTRVIMPLDVFVIMPKTRVTSLIQEREKRKRGRVCVCEREKGRERESEQPVLFIPSFFCFQVRFELPNKSKKKKKLVENSFNM